MKIATLLMALAITLILSGCSGLKLHHTKAETAAAPQKPAETPPIRSDLPKSPQNDRQPRIIQGAPALAVAGTDENCLALNVYYEAGIEPEIGKIAIANVTINRLATGRWGDNLCDVVYADAQFSWTALSRLRRPSGTSWDDSLKAARNAIKGLRIESLHKALYYHATYVRPYWRLSMKKIQQIGRHIFYAESRTAQATLLDNADPICALLLRSAAVEFDSCADAVRPAGP